MALPTYPLLISEAHGVRSLHFGSEWVQGAMRIRDPLHLELEYTRHLMAALLLFDPLPASTLQIGLGAGSISKFLLHVLPEARHTVVEFDRRIPAFARAHFALPAPPQLRVVIDEGAAWLARSREQQALIVVDAFDERARDDSTRGTAFYRDALSRLSPGGVLAVNVFGRERLYASALRALRAFAQPRVLALPRCATGNRVLLALDRSAVLPPAGVLAERARRLRAMSGLGLVALARHMR